MRSLKRVCCYALAFSLACDAAFGWSEVGHRAVASLAYALTGPGKRSEVADLLRRHPRFDEDFAAMMPAEVRDGGREMQDEWIFQQAAYWPDIARGIPGSETEGPRATFNRPTWHYVNQPLFLTPADREALDGRLSANLAYDVPTDPSLLPRMNVVQAIRHATSVAGDASRPEAERAVQVAWLFHLVGDVHQPMHSTALFSEGRFPEGDKGGNLIKTRPDDNLHAVWDRFPGGEGERKVGTYADFLAAKEMAAGLLADQTTKEIGERAVPDRDVAAWLAESRELAVSVAYTPAVLAHVRALPPAAGEATPELALDEEYLAAGRKSSARRVTAAGFRLGDLLDRLP